MNPNGLWSGRDSLTPPESPPPGASPAELVARTPLPPGPPKGEVVRVSIADVLPPPGLQPPTESTFDELEIPAPLRAAVEKELTRDEQLLWVGRPSRNPEVHPKNKVLPVVGGGLIALALVIVVGALATGGRGFIPFAFAGIMTLIGLAFMLPLVVNPAKVCRYCYAVTNRRALLAELTLGMRGGVVTSYLPQQLVGMDRKDHPSVPGAGDLVLDYQFALSGNSFNTRTGTLFQQNTTGGLSTSPQRVARGFLYLDQVREVEELIRARLLTSLEQAIDASNTQTYGRNIRQAAPAVSAACGCGVTVEAPAALSGKSVKCPRCSAAVALGPRQTEAESAPVSCREDGSIPTDLREAALAGLDPSEKPVWIGRPVAKLVLLRNGGYLAASAAGILAALAWLYLSVAPAKATPARAGKPAAPAAQQVVPGGGSPLPPLVLLAAFAAVSAPALVRWRTAARTCYVLTNRRAMVYREGLFGKTRDSYPPLEVAGMRPSGSWLVAGCGDLIFRTVQVVTYERKQSLFGSNTSIRTIHYGFLAVAQLDEVEKVVRETLVDPFVDKLTSAV
jgi:hypothetical protein